MTIGPVSVVYFIVSSQGAKECQPWGVQKWEDQNFASYDTDNETPRFYSLVQRPARAANKSVQLSAVRSGGKLTIRDPRMTSGARDGSPASIGDCEQDFEAKKTEPDVLTFSGGLRLYLNESACSSALLRGEVTTLGACQAVVDRFAEGVQLPAVNPQTDPLRRTIRAGGVIFWRDERDGRCDKYQFISKAADGSAGQLVAFRQDSVAGGTARESYAYRFNTYHLTLSGPKTEASGHGSESGATDTWFVGARTTDRVVIGERFYWFFNRASCESATSGQRQP